MYLKKTNLRYKFNWNSYSKLFVNSKGPMINTCKGKPEKPDLANEMPSSIIPGVIYLILSWAMLFEYCILECTFFFRCTIKVNPSSDLLIMNC